MKSRLLLVFVWIAICTTAIAQKDAQFNVLVPDTVGMEGYFEAQFILENVAGQKFSPPDFEGFRIVGGPDQSSSFSMVNGKTTQSMTYTYYLEPIETGHFLMGEASIQTDNGERLTLPKTIVVVDQFENKKPPATARRKMNIFPEDNPEIEKTKPVKPRKIYKL